MKNLLLLVAFLFSFSVFAQRSPITPNIRKLKNDTIIWKPDSLLRKEDFKARPRSKNGPLGLSAIGLLLYPGESGGQLLFYVEALFVKSKSYLVEFSVYVLRHEQIHFDISEVYARILRKRIAETNFKKVRNATAEINKLYEKTSAELFREETKYDNDTQHGINSAKQKVWEEDIARRLKELDAYKELSVNIAQ